MTRVLLLLPTRTYRTADFLAAADRLGVEVVVGAERRNALESLADGGTMLVRLDDPERGAAMVERYAREHPLDAVVGVDDGSTVVAAAAAERLGLPHNPPDAVRRSRDKAQTRAAFAAAGLATPTYAVHSALIDAPALATLAEATRYPSVLKPLERSGSQGVIRADNPEQLVAAFRRIAVILGCDVDMPGGSADGRGRHPKILIEDFIPGVEVAVEGILRGGELEVLAIFDKPDPLDGPFFEETLLVTPSRLSLDRQREVEAAVARATQALGLREGPVHAEVRLNDQGTWLLEVAARSIGGLCARTLRFGAGVSLEELILRHAAGLELPAHQREEVASGVLMLPIPRAGRLRDVRGQAAAAAVPHIEGLSITVPRGEMVVPLPEGDRYLGFLFARAPSPDAVEVALRAAWAALDVVISEI
ncbi:MAG: ATP-grasp domain-containing protein [Chloroflexota bacterium]|nr:ATP-grasp domain-containing protein [Chloroflexota bacterium]